MKPMLLTLTLALLMLPLSATMAEEALPVSATASTTATLETTDAGITVQGSADDSREASLIEEEAPIFFASTCTATANCGSRPSVTCNGNSSCITVDRNCAAGQNGYVQCDGVKTNCTHNSSCTSQCQTQYWACVGACTVRDPCVPECAEARSYCMCEC